MEFLAQLENNPQFQFWMLLFCEMVGVFVAVSVDTSSKKSFNNPNPVIVVVSI